MEREGLRCLSCHDPVEPGTVKLYYRVFVCERCYDCAEKLVTSTQADLRKLQSMFVAAIRQAILKGELGGSGSPDKWTTEERVSLLVQSVEEIAKATQEDPCPTSTPETRTPILAYGESIEPNALTQGADGEKSSSSPDR